MPRYYSGYGESRGGYIWYPSVRVFIAFIGRGGIDVGVSGRFVLLRNRFCGGARLRWMPLWTSRPTLSCLAVGTVILLIMGCARPQGGRRSNRVPGVLTIKGSDTMVHLVSTWAEVYMERHPEAEISVTGGGSGTGFAALLNATTDICAASREMLPKEKRLARDRGITPIRHVVARDGIAVIVHPTNPVDSLSIEQVRKIYIGVYDNWDQVAGQDREIVVFSRDTSSGTYLFFQQHVLRRQDFRASARLLPATSAIVQSVAEDQGAIGYVGLGYALDALDSVKSVAIKGSPDGQAIEPSMESVRSDRYPITRQLRLYTSGEPTGVAASFVAFCLGPEGQSIVQETGYVVAD